MSTLKVETVVEHGVRNVVYRTQLGTRFHLAMEFVGQPVMMIHLPGSEFAVETHLDGSIGPCSCGEVNCHHGEQVERLVLDVLTYVPELIELERAS